MKKICLTLVMALSATILPAVNNIPVYAKENMNTTIESASQKSEMVSMEVLDHIGGTPTYV